MLLKLNVEVKKESANFCVIIPNSESRLTFCSPGTDYNIIGIYRKFLLEAHCLFNRFGYHVAQISASYSLWYNGFLLQLYSFSEFYS